MRTLEVRRHAERARPEETLTEEGERGARRLGSQLGRFDRVVTSPLPRAILTARAMGQEVDRVDERWASLGSAVEREVPWPSPFGAYVDALDRRGAASALADRLRDSAEGLASELAEDGRGLILTHGGFPELLAGVLAKPPDRLRAEEPVGYLEGIRIELRDEAIPDVRVVRVREWVRYGEADP
ncbi:MAG TPA: histidine phosphatase family protein [Thermoplasmata archaeon]|nr:histidine phosphatase family protein [Thermoplasmata archaeon]